MNDKLRVNNRINRIGFSNGGYLGCDDSGYIVWNFMCFQGLGSQKFRRIEKREYRGYILKLVSIFKFKLLIYVVKDRMVMGLFGRCSVLIVCSISDMQGFYLIYIFIEGFGG